jgi:hypothetical protein
MHGNTVTVLEHQTLLEVLHLLVVAGIGGAPVVGADGAVVGVLTSTDMLRALEQAVDEDRHAGESDDLLESLQMITAGPRSCSPRGEQHACGGEHVRGSGSTINAVVAQTSRTLLTVARAG